MKYSVKKLLTLIALVIISVFFIANQQEELTTNGMTAKKHLDKLGYKVLSYEGRVSSYKLTEESLEGMPNSVIWRLPGNTPEPYMGKTIFIEKFKVRNHPLDHWKCCGVKANGMVYTFVFIVDGKVAGGSSYPVLSKWEDHLAGGYWSLDGRETE